MTNFEYYKNKLQQLAGEAINIGIRNGEPINCNKIECNECDLHGNCWHAGFVKWLYQEYAPAPSRVDWSKVEVDTPILVSMDENRWIRRHFARYVNGRVYFFQNGETSWTQKLEPVSWKYAKLKEDKNCPNKLNVYQKAEKALENYRYINGK